jgi:hypothetical protein
LNKKWTVLVAIVIAITIGSITGYIIFTEANNRTSGELSFSYVQTNKDLKEALSKHNISMSSPLRLKGEAIEQYCNFFSNDSLQSAIEYCTSTELVDSDGKYLGNIHMVGSIESPRFVMGVVQVPPTLDNLNSVKTVYQTMIETLVCQCWNEEKPGGFDSVSDWIDAANSHHLEAKRTTSKSEISGIAHKGLLLEITTNTEGYLWKFVVPN